MKNIMKMGFLALLTLMMSVNTSQAILGLFRGRGAGPLGNVAEGALEGAAVGGIFGGRKGAKIGTGVGIGLGLIDSMANRRRSRYNDYDDYDVDRWGNRI